MHMPQLARYWTVDDLYDLPDDGNRYEVIDGELFVTPAPSLRHQRAVAELWRILDRYLDKLGIAEAFFSPADIQFSSSRLVQPDVFVLPLKSGRRVETFADVGRLLLVAEVLSPSTARTDRAIKRGVFRDAGVPAYWIVDLDARTFERSTPIEERTELLVDEVRWQPVGAPRPLIIDLPTYFARVLDT